MSSFENRARSFLHTITNTYNGVKVAEGDLADYQTLLVATRIENKRMKPVHRFLPTLEQDYSCQGEGCSVQ